jgi:hypothetical protein
LQQAASAERLLWSEPMPLRDPVAVYNAANNIEAHLVRNALNDSGIEAFAAEDNSQAGTWMMGMIPEIHKPQVWVDRADVARAKPVLEDFERRAAELQDTGAQDRPPIEVICEECGQRSTFPAAQRGSVQQCRHCGAYVDVGGDAIMEPWPESQGEEGIEAEP